MNLAVWTCFALLLTGLPRPLPLGQSSEHGTKDNPYIISSAADLTDLAKAVNEEGRSFRNQWFVQSSDIDLAGVDFIPIGTFDSQAHFEGIYDGDGHVLKNLSINRVDNAGLFGALGGVVMNLGIESGNIHGACTGAFSSHSSSSDALIFNCYNKANVSGGRAGGIADNFNGTILSCYSDCVLSGGEIGGLVSYAAARISFSFCANNEPFPPGVNIGQNCYRVATEESSQTAEKLNQSLYSVSTHGLAFSNANTWISEAGELKQKGKAQFDLWRYLGANWLNLLPYGFAFLSISGICVGWGIGVNKAKKKAQNEE
ncbi:MAG: hypothetical protein IJU64_00970 [Bacilli bacterium]|nr:hypothetical protein [Bacilli bacterium]